MKLHFLIAIFCLLLTGCGSIRKLYIQYGSVREQQEQLHDDVIRVYIDRTGFLYPDGTGVSDRLLKKYYSMHEQLYMKKRTIYEQVCQQYNVTPYTGNRHEFGSDNDPLQEAIIT